jgi:basic membrane protein A
LRRGMRSAAVLAVATMALAACGSGSDSTGASGKTVKVGLAFDIGGRGDKSFNDAAYAGLERARKDLSVQIKDLSARAQEPESDKEERLRLLADSGYDPVIAVGFVYAGPLAKVAAEFPDVKFQLIDAVVDAPNVASATFAAEQGSFLVGAAAALKSTTGNVGFVGGCTTPLIETFEAGYLAGARAVNPGIRVQSKYLSSPPGCTGFQDPGTGRTTATGMYEDGADIVYHAAGGSGPGVFQAAKAAGKKAIGVDSDQYQTADAAVRDVIMTSMLKRVDVAVFDFIQGYADGEFTAGETHFDLKAEGVGYATTGGQIDDIVPKLEEFEQKIVDGAITVPTKPAKS